MGRSDQCRKTPSDFSLNHVRGRKETCSVAVLSCGSGVCETRFKGRSMSVVVAVAVAPSGRSTTITLSLTWSRTALMARRTGVRVS